MHAWKKVPDSNGMRNYFLTRCNTERPFTRCVKTITLSKRSAVKEMTRAGAVVDLELLINCASNGGNLLPFNSSYPVLESVAQESLC